MVLADIAQRGLAAWWGPLLAFAAGVVSCASPCVLPLVPGYVAFVAGSDRPDADHRAQFAPILLFIAGFTVVFTLIFGLTASVLARWILLPVGQRIAGGVVFVFGGLMVLYGLRVAFPALYWESRPLLNRIEPGKIGAFPLGMAFAVGWTPCIGPVLGLILTLAAAQHDTPKTLLLLLSYSIGLGLPFALIGLGIRRAMGAFRFFSRNYQWFAGIGGAVMMTFGVLLISGVWVRLLAPFLGLVNRFTPAL
jgi:cytochrome c-type biogenesis protein